jgi:hypothetical protein
VLPFESALGRARRDGWLVGSGLGLAVLPLPFWLASAVAEGRAVALALG